MGPRSEYRPAGLYETMIQRIAPYTLAGFLLPVVGDIAKLLHETGDVTLFAEELYPKLLKVGRSDNLGGSLLKEFPKLCRFFKHFDQSFQLLLSCYLKKY